MFLIYVAFTIKIFYTTIQQEGGIIVKDILRPIGVIARSLDSIANIEFKKFDLTRGQYLYLVRIAENPGIIQERLVRTD